MKFHLKRNFYYRFVSLSRFRSPNVFADITNSFYLSFFQSLSSFFTHLLFFLIISRCFREELWALAAAIPKLILFQSIEWNEWKKFVTGSIVFLIKKEVNWQLLHRHRIMLRLYCCFSARIIEQNCSNMQLKSIHQSMKTLKTIRLLKRKKRLNEKQQSNTNKYRISSYFLLVKDRWNIEFHWLCPRIPNFHPIFFSVSLIFHSLP